MKSENLFVKAFARGFKNFGQNVTNVVNFILLFAVYFVGVGTTAIIAKATGKKFLELKIRKKTYWKERNLGKKPLEEYYRQF